MLKEFLNGSKGSTVSIISGTKPSLYGLSSDINDHRCLCVLPSHLFWTSGLWTYQPGSHMISSPSFCCACLIFSREKDSALPLPRREVYRISCAYKLIVLCTTEPVDKIIYSVLFCILCQKISRNTTTSISYVCRSCCIITMYTKLYFQHAHFITVVGVGKERRIALSQLQGFEWGWPGRREPNDEHSPAS